MTTEADKALSEILVEALGDLALATARLEAQVDASAELEPVDQAGATALVKDLRQRLGKIESTLAETLGKAEGELQGYLPDGRIFTLKRSPDRKAWNHEDWKRDARRNIVRAITDRYEVPSSDHEDYLVESATGETKPLGTVLHEAITEAQEVHGSTQPRSTSLKRLGLYASNYCETSPGGWLLNAIAPHDTTTDDTKG